MAKNSPPKAALTQIELITGSAETPIRLRAIPPRGRGVPQEREGTLAELHDWARGHSAAGCNIYMVAQPTKPDCGYTKDKDVTGVRCLYADGDDCELPDKWHAEPTFILVHPKTGRWWAFWRVHGCPLDDLRDAIKRIALRYDADQNVCNPGRIVRLAGYDRWKDGKNFGPYKLTPRTGETTAWSEHDGTLDPYERKQIKKGDGGDDCIGEERLRYALSHIDPQCGDPGTARNDWIGILGAIVDARVGCPDGTYMDFADMIELADD